MTLSELTAHPEIEILQEDYEDAPISGAYTSDLLSDVMAHAEDGNVLITIQAHNNTVAVAALAGVSGIIICGKRVISEDMLASARKERMPVFRTALNQFEASCLIGSLLRG